MDISRILDPDPHENLCGSETDTGFKSLEGQSVLPGVSVLSSVVDPNTLNLDPDQDSGFWPNLAPNPDPGLYNQF